MELAGRIHIPAPPKDNGARLQVEGVWVKVRHRFIRPSQYARSLQRYRQGHPHVQGAVVVVRAENGRVVLPQNVAIDWDVDAPMIEVQLDD